jgi:hypothetical protein
VGVVNSGWRAGDPDTMLRRELRADDRARERREDVVEVQSAALRIVKTQVELGWAHLDSYRERRV